MASGDDEALGRGWAGYHLHAGSPSTGHSQAPLLRRLPVGAARALARRDRRAELDFSASKQRARNWKKMKKKTTVEGRRMRERLAGPSSFASFVRKSRPSGSEASAARLATLADEKTAN